MNIRKRQTLGTSLARAHALTFAILLGCALSIVYFAASAELARRIDADLAEDVDEFTRSGTRGVTRPWPPNSAGRRHSMEAKMNS